MNRALVLAENGPHFDPEYQSVIRPGEATLRLQLGGICATDLELARGYMGFRGVLGHEWVGIVESAPDAKWVGERVVGDINCPCHTCDTCQRKMPTHCPHRTVLGIQNRDGAFADTFTLPVENLHRIPEQVANEAAVFVEPLAAALEILEAVSIRPSAHIVVLGAGRLGNLCARVLALTGADVTCVSATQRKAVFLPPSIRFRLSSEVQSLEAAADLVVDCTGSPDGLSLASKLVQPRGTVVLKTTVHSPVLPPLNSWVINETRVIGSRCGPFAPALRLLASGVIDPRPLITATFPLASGVEALRAAASGNHMKVVLSP